MSAVVVIHEDNIKDELGVGDQVMIDDGGPYSVEYTYWDSIFSDDDDLGFRVDEGADDLCNVICDMDIRSQHHKIVKI